MLHVIICDDDPILCQRLHQMLMAVASKDILSIQTFNGGEKLLQFLEDHSAPPTVRPKTSVFYGLYCDL